MLFKLLILQHGKWLLMAYILNSVKRQVLEYLEVDLLIQGFQFSKDGLESKRLAIEVIANNLANVSSVGFKRSNMFSQSLDRKSVV